MAVTDFSQQRWGDPDGAVQVRDEDGWWPGFIDARRQRDHVWEALVIFTVQRDGYPHTRRGWFAYNERKTPVP